MESLGEDETGRAPRQVTVIYAARLACVSRSTSRRKASIWDSDAVRASFRSSMSTEAAPATGAGAAIGKGVAVDTGTGALS